MAKKKNTTLTVDGLNIRLAEYDHDNYISLTDIARRSSDRTDIVISNWMRNRNTVEFLGLWEQLYNPSFNPIGFDGIRKDTGLNGFVMTAKKWITSTNAIGIVSKAGRYGGTYAHEDIALEFASWVNVSFKLYLIKEFKRLKIEEEKQKNQELEWKVKRVMAKGNYRILTDAVREHLIPPKIQYTKDEWRYFANEADIINIALFGKTAKMWRIENPDKKGNIRDHATPEQLLVLSNLQSLDASLMEWDCDQEQRLQLLNQQAIKYMKSLLSGSSLKQLPSIDEKKRLEAKERKNNKRK